jgi:hypothetical protein
MRRVSPASCLSSSTALRSRVRGQQSHGLPSVSRRSQRKKCSFGEPSPKSTLASAFGSAFKMRSPNGPKGVGAIVPRAVNMMLVGVQPTPLASRLPSRPVGKPLPRTVPEMSM